QRRGQWGTELGPGRDAGELTAGGLTDLVRGDRHSRGEGEASVARVGEGTGHLRELPHERFPAATLLTVQVSPHGGVTPQNPEQGKDRRERVPDDLHRDDGDAHATDEEDHGSLTDPGDVDLPLEPAADSRAPEPPVQLL